MLALGLILFLLGAVLLLVEAHATTGGLLGGGAVLAGVAGIALLLLAAGTGVLVGVLVAIVLGAGAAGLLLLSGRRALVALGRRPRTGPEALVGHLGVVRSTGGPQVRVFVDGAIWRAHPDLLDEHTALHEGDHVVVERVNGLTLSVRKAEEWELTR